jgi:urease accessory protein UreH
MTALRELIEAVEAEREPTKDEWRAIFPDLPDDDDYHRCHMAFAANQGWLDAARALHEAVLPEWEWEVFSKDGVLVWLPNHISEKNGVHFVARFRAEADNPARAWLLAILKALEAHGGQHERT